MFFFLSDFWTTENCYLLEPGIWAVGRIWELFISSLSRSKQCLWVFRWQVGLSGNPLYPHLTHGVKEAVWKPTVLLMHHYSWCTLYPLALNVYWCGGGSRVGWGGGNSGGEKTKLYACLLCFAEQMRGWFIIYRVVCGRVKLNSRHWNIEALFKNGKKKMGHLNFFIADTNWCVVEFCARVGQWRVGGAR